MLGCTPHLYLSWPSCVPLPSYLILCSLFQFWFWDPAGTQVPSSYWLCGLHSGVRSSEEPVWLVQREEG